VQRQSDGLTVRFELTDTAKTIPIQYTGILPTCSAKARASSRSAASTSRVC